MFHISAIDQIINGCEYSSKFHVVMPTYRIQDHGLYNDRHSRFDLYCKQVPWVKCQ